MLNRIAGTLMILEGAPKGDNEERTMNFVRGYDEYDAAPVQVSTAA